MQLGGASLVTVRSKKLHPRHHWRRALLVWSGLLHIRILRRLLLRLRSLGEPIAALGIKRRTVLTVMVTGVLRALAAITMR